MAYLVRVQPRAERDLRAIFTYIRAQTSPPAQLWIAGMLDAIAGLKEHPLRHPATHEDPSFHQLLYGNKPHIYRVIYSVNLTAQRVDVIHVRHHARKPF